jgi:hypothetical protein
MTLFWVDVSSIDQESISHFCSNHRRLRLINACYAEAATSGASAMRAASEVLVCVQMERRYARPPILGVAVAEFHVGRRVRPSPFKRSRADLGQLNSDGDAEPFPAVQDGLPFLPAARLAVVVNPIGGVRDDVFLKVRQRVVAVE